ncbi:MAG: hypothetical protein Q9227_001796 [Pyrenula ochraceoflavens]
MDQQQSTKAQSKKRALKITFIDIPLCYTAPVISLAIEHFFTPAAADLSTFFDIEGLLVYFAALLLLLSPWWLARRLSPKTILLYLLIGLTLRAYHHILLSFIDHDHHYTDTPIGPTLAELSSSSSSTKAKPFDINIIKTFHRTFNHWFLQDHYHYNPLMYESTKPANWNWTHFQIYEIPSVALVFACALYFHFFDLEVDQKPSQPSPPPPSPPLLLELDEKFEIEPPPPPPPPKPLTNQQALYYTTLLGLLTWPIAMIIGKIKAEPIIEPIFVDHPDTAVLDLVLSVIFCIWFWQWALQFCCLLVIIIVTLGSTPDTPELKCHHCGMRRLEEGVGKQEDLLL